MYNRMKRFKSLSLNKQRTQKTIAYTFLMPLQMPLICLSLCIFSLSMSGMEQAIAQPQPSIVDKIDLETDDPKVVVTIDGHLLKKCPFLLTATEFEQRIKSNNKNGSRLKLDCLKQFSAAILKKFIESLVLRSEKKELHTFFQYDDLTLPIALAELATFINDNELLDICAFAFATTFVQPGICQKADIDVIQALASLGSDWEKFKETAAFYLKARMGRPLHVYEGNNGKLSYAKIDRTGSFVVLRRTNNITIISAHSGKRVNKLKTNIIGETFELKYLPLKNSSIYLEHNNRRICIWELEPGKLLAHIKVEDILPRESSKVCSIDCTKSGDTLIIQANQSHSPDNLYVVLWNLERNKSIASRNGRIYGFNQMQDVCVLRQDDNRYEAFDTVTGNALPIIAQDELPHYMGNAGKVLVQKLERFPDEIQSESNRVYFEIRNNKKKTFLSYVTANQSFGFNSLGTIVHKEANTQNMLLFQPFDRYLQYKNRLELWEKDEQNQLVQTYTLNNVDGKDKGGSFFVNPISEELVDATYVQGPQPHTRVIWDLSTKNILNKWSFANCCTMWSDSKGEKFLFHTEVPSQEWNASGKKSFAIWYNYQHQDVQEKLTELAQSLEAAPLEAVLYAFLYTQIPTFNMLCTKFGEFTFSTEQLSLIEKIRSLIIKLLADQHVTVEKKLNRTDQYAAKLCVKQSST